MIPLIGQKKLIDMLDGYTLDNMPRAILFLGENGCGKHLFSTYLAERLALECIDIPADVEPDQLTEYYRYPMPRMYRLNLIDIQEKQQNKFLKFIEEPSSNMYVILLAESEVGVLPTILNRCQKLRFEQYTTEQLQELSWAISADEIIYDICRTPGQLLNVNGDSLNAAKDLCDTILRRAKDANFPNMIKIVTKINCKDQYERIDFELFFKLLTHMAFVKYRDEADEFAFKLYSLLIDKESSRLGKAIAKESYLLDFLCELWEISRTNETRRA